MPPAANCIAASMPALWFFGEGLVIFSEEQTRCKKNHEKSSANTICRNLVRVGVIIARVPNRAKAFYMLTAVYRVRLLNENTRLSENMLGSSTKLKALTQLFQEHVLTRYAAYLLSLNHGERIINN